VQLQLSIVLIRLTVLAMVVCGALCILCAAIFLLHQWFPWWQAFGLTGLTFFVLALLTNIAVRPRSKLKP